MTKFQVWKRKMAKQDAEEARRHAKMKDFFSRASEALKADRKPSRQ